MPRRSPSCFCTGSHGSSCSRYHTQITIYLHGQSISQSVLVCGNGLLTSTGYSIPTLILLNTRRSQLIPQPFLEHQIIIYRWTSSSSGSCILDLQYLRVVVFVSSTTLQHSSSALSLSRSLYIPPAPSISFNRATQLSVAATKRPLSILFNR